MPDLRREPDDILDLDDDPSSAELQDQVQRAQAELGELKRRAEQIERDKQRLEDLSRKQDELEAGRVDMVEKITRSMAIIQRESAEAQKRLDHLQTIHDAFLRHIRTLESINPKQWIGGDLAKELSKALSAVDDARAEYSKAKTKLIPDRTDEAAMAAGAEYEDDAGGERGFLYWFTTGLAFTLPLIVTILVVTVLVWLSMQTGAH